MDQRRLAPRAGLEPATLRLTAGCSAIELPRNMASLRDVRREAKPDDRSGRVRRAARVGRVRGRGTRPRRDYFSILICINAPCFAASSVCPAGKFDLLRRNAMMSLVCCSLSDPGALAGIEGWVFSKRSPTVFQFATKSLPASAGIGPLPARSSPWHAAQFSLYKASPRFA